MLNTNAPESFPETRQVTSEGIILHTVEDLEQMRQAGQLAASTLDYITPYVTPGVTTEHLDRLCHDFISEHGAVPAPLNYKGFPKSVCISVNHVVCHGIPGERPLKDGDILNIDVTVILNGWHGDTSRMFWAGDSNISRKAARLTDVTYEALWEGIHAVAPGQRFGAIGAAIQKYVEARYFSTVEDFCGHGLGLKFHAPPSVLHYGPAEAGAVMQPGMFFTIEPMINAGRAATKILPDGWTAITRDRSLSAQFEHTVAVTPEGYEVLTRSPQGYEKPPYLNA